jgi:hypothetical protein
MTKETYATREELEAMSDDELSRRQLTYLNWSMQPDTVAAATHNLIAQILRERAMSTRSTHERRSKPSR